MRDLMGTLFGSGFMPHGHCYLWQPGVLWLNVGSDALIALAYYSIPVGLAVVMRRRSDIVFPSMFALFAAFIFACGTTHLMAIWTVWNPVYGVEGLVKAATAGLSVLTAILLFRLLPEALALPTSAAIEAANAALEAANAALAIEVGQRKRAEEGFRNLLESAPDGMVIADAAGCITFANAQTEVLFGFPRAELIGQSIETLVPERLRDSHAAHRTSYLCGPRLRPMGAGLALHGRRRDGSEFPIEISLSPLETEGGTLVTAAIRDITERREAEETVREYGVRLEALSRQLLTTQEAERRAIAAELHDEIGQSLTALKLGLDRCRQRPEPAVLEENIGLVEHVLQEVRELSRGLRPAHLDELGLAAALRWFVDRQARRAGWVGRVEADGLEPRLAPDLEVACFRIAQEAITNVMRHAGADHVTVRVQRIGGGIEILVHDDGCGMDVAGARRSALRGVSMGLLGMEERVSSLGGRLEVTST
ncbi:MAG: PAS domain S-box protein, partial [Candidatus Binatia bacterium]